jgi:hypothetical protein
MRTNHIHMTTARPGVRSSELAASVVDGGP